MEVDHNLLEVNNNTNSGNESKNSGRQQKLMNIRKEKSRDAARNRRSKENLQYVELAKLLPLPEAVTSQLDKASVIRLTISFLKYRDLVGNDVEKRDNGMIQQASFGGKLIRPQAFEKDLGLHLLQALDGFIFCVSQDGKFLYISETVSTYLGLSQLDLVGSSVFNVIHPDDQRDFSELLRSSVPASYTDCLNLDDLDGLNFSDIMTRRQDQKEITIFTRMKCTLVKRGGCFVKAAGYKVIHIRGQMVPFRNFDHNGERAVALVATGKPLPPPTICELKLDTKVFVSRVGMDLRIAFCEGKIRKYMDFTAKDIVGVSAYEFYHLKDMTIVQDAHTDCLTGGKCVSTVYRWMNKTGGWVRMQTVGTVLKRNTPKGEEQQILCVNYICSDVEEGGNVMHSIQQRFKTLEITNGGDKKENLDDFGSELSSTPCSDDVKASLEAATDNSGTVFDKDSYLLALQYKDQVRASKTTASSSNPLELFIGAQGYGIPSINDHIPTWQESQAMDDANALATNLLMAEMETETTPLRFPFEDAPSSPDSGLCDMSPNPNTQLNQSFMPPTKEVYIMKSTDMPSPNQSNNGVIQPEGMPFATPNCNDAFMFDSYNQNVPDLMTRESPYNVNNINSRMELSNKMNNPQMMSNEFGLKNTPPLVAPSYFHQPKNSPLMAPASTGTKIYPPCRQDAPSLQYANYSNGNAQFLDYSNNVMNSLQMNLNIQMDSPPFNSNSVHLNHMRSPPYNTNASTIVYNQERSPPFNEEVSPACIPKQQQYLNNVYIKNEPSDYPSDLANCIMNQSNSVPNFSNQSNNAPNFSNPYMNSNSFFAQSNCQNFPSPSPAMSQNNYPDMPLLPNMSITNYDSYHQTPYNQNIIPQSDFNEARISQQKQLYHFGAPVHMQ